MTTKGTVVSWRGSRKSKRTLGENGGNLNNTNAPVLAQE